MHENVLRSDTPKEIAAKRTGSPSPGDRAWGTLGINHGALDRVIGKGRGELEGQALTAGSLDGRSVFCLGHAVHAESTPLAAVLQRTFGADEIDAAKRQFGQTKDLAHGPQDPELRARVLALHGQGDGPCRIARATGISRKQVARLLESEGITREPSR